MWFDDTIKPVLGHLIPDQKGHSHVAQRLRACPNRSEMIDWLALCPQALRQSRYCLSSLSAGMNAYHHHQPKIGPRIPADSTHTRLCACVCSRPSWAFGVILNTKLTLAGTQRGQGRDTMDVLSSHPLAVCHFLPVASWLTSSRKYVVKDFRKNKTPKLFFFFLYASNRCN